MEKILNFEIPLDIEVFDRVVACVYKSKNTQEIEAAQKVLTAFQNHELSWTRVDAILEKSTSQESKFLALQVLSLTIQFKWNIINKQQQQGIKNYIVSNIITKSSNPDTLKNEKVLISKMNEVLVQILKQEWPHNWRNFIPEIVGASKSSESLCENNMSIFKLMSEEIFDFSNGKMTMGKIAEMKQNFNKEFSLIFELCDYILAKATKPSLITATLNTLLRFLNWIPIGYIFETKLIENLVKFFQNALFRNDTLRCLTEIVSIPTQDPKYLTLLGQFYTFFLQLLMKMLPPSSTNIPEIYKKASDYDQQFIQVLGLFFTSFYKNFLPYLEKVNMEACVGGHMYLIEISKVDEAELFKTCLEYWNWLCEKCYFKIKEGKKVLLLDNNPSRNPYSKVMELLRLVMISKMAKPEEVIIVEDENGSVIREYLKDVDSIALYKSMRETLIFLTHLDYEDTENKMIAKLAAQVDGSEWSRNNLNSLCWAIGSISGAMEEKDEKRFLVAVIKDLLGLVDNKKGKENKAIVASNIMYVVGQYPRFLLAHWKFLKTVVYKLFEFMHETFQGVQEMACDTFLTIAKKCSKKFVGKNQGETRPFIEEILQDLDSIISALEPNHICIFYEAIGYIIAAEGSNQESYVLKLMNRPNNIWANHMKGAYQTNGKSLQNTDCIRELVNILRINLNTSKSLGNGYHHQLKLIYKDMLSVYKLYSNMITQEIKQNGPNATQHAAVRGMRAVKKEILLLIENFVQNCEDASYLTRNYIPPLFEAILGDYYSSLPEAKNPMVLSVVGAAITKLKNLVADDVPKILESVVDCTLPMITKNFHDFPEHRLHYFKLLHAIVIHTFNGLFSIPPQGFRLVVNSMLWAVKHTEHGISETGLYMVKELMLNMEKTKTDAINLFYKTYYIQIFNDIFFILTDRFHFASFAIQCQILFHMIHVLTKLGFQFDGNKNNVQYMQEYLANLITNAFTNLNSQVVIKFVQGLFVNNEIEFENHLRDFLVDVKVYSKELTEKHINDIQKLEKQKQVPGLIKE